MASEIALHSFAFVAIAVTKKETSQHVVAVLHEDERYINATFDG